MIEIIPNWHPMFVHFTVALLFMAGIGFIIAHFTQRKRYQPNILKVAEWNFWIGALISIITVLAGSYAYNTVAHDAPSHAAMTDHRNWALVTMGILFMQAIWLWRIRRNGHLRLTTPFVILIVILMGALAGTAWRGGELVYRYGLGVMSLPQNEGDNHEHDHGGSHSDNIGQEHEPIKKIGKPDKDAHDHSTHSH